MIFPLKEPKPDFESLDKVIRGKKAPEKVHFVEEFADVEIINYIVENMMEERFPKLDEVWPSLGSDSHLIKKIDGFQENGEFKFIDGEPDIIRLKRDIAFYYRMGFDYVPDLYPWTLMPILLTTRLRSEFSSKGKARQTRDTTDDEFSRGTRNWQEEKTGLITTWEDFEKIDWDKIDLDKMGFEEYFKTAEKNLPEGMKMPIVGCLFDPGVIGNFMGFEDFCYLLYEKPDLIKALIDKFGQINYQLYERAISLDCVGFMWHADDFAFGSGTMISKDHLKKYVLPWFKKYSALAHKHNKTFWLHACGNMYELMPELIEDVKIDAKQSFEDKIMPVVEFKERYGDKVTPLGGVDVDKLCRLPEDKLRIYCKNILEKCMYGGRYAYGTGNSVANYIPVGNYLAMMEEGYRYL
jgi:uroporphyrinogen decarboxylase